MVTGRTRPGDAVKAAADGAHGADRDPRARTHTVVGVADPPGGARTWRSARSSAKLHYPGARRQQPRWGTSRMAEIEDNVDRELFRNVEKLRQLRIEHRDLDEVITRLSLDLHVDQLQLKRLKKRKLMLKDQIARLESQLIPDLNA